MKRMKEMVIITRVDSPSFLFWLVDPPTTVNDIIDLFAVIDGSRLPSHSLNSPERTSPVPDLLSPSS
jgi:hypothetical protein